MSVEDVIGLKSSTHKENLKASAIHQKHQIKWQHLDPIKFTIFNIGLHFLSDLLLYPPDVIRTRLQVQVLVIILQTLNTCNTCFHDIYILLL